MRRVEFSIDDGHGEVIATSYGIGLFPILNFWTSRQTNARVEGFNNRSARSPARWTKCAEVDEPAEGGCLKGTRVNKAKLVKRRAYGTALKMNRNLLSELQTQTPQCLWNLAFSQTPTMECEEPKRRAYGYISFPNYRLRLLNACGG